MNEQLLDWCMAKPFYERSDEELMAFLSCPYEGSHLYREFRVKAYVFLLARMGDARTEMPYEVWALIMGDIPPPTTFGRGMFPLVPDPRRFYEGIH